MGRSTWGSRNENLLWNLPFCKMEGGWECEGRCYKYSKFREKRRSVAMDTTLNKYCITWISLNQD